MATFCQCVPSALVNIDPVRLSVAITRVPVHSALSKRADPIPPVARLHVRPSALHIAPCPTATNRVPVQTTFAASNETLGTRCQLVPFELVKKPPSAEAATHRPAPKAPCVVAPPASCQLQDGMVGDAAPTVTTTLAVIPPAIARIVVVPRATAAMVAVDPLPVIDTTDEFALDHATLGEEIGPVALLTLAVTVSRSPTALRRTPAGEMDTLITSTPGTTVTGIDAVTPPARATIVAVPTDTAVTVTLVPVALTVATAALLLDHVTVGFVATPALVFTVAVSCPVVPTPVKLSVAGAITTDCVVIGGFTVTLVDPDCPPDVAVMVALPGATVVTVAVAPLPDTVATAVLLLVQATVGALATPTLVVTVAVSVPVAPAPVSVSVAGTTVTESVVTGAGGVGPPPLSPALQEMQASSSAVSAAVRGPRERRRSVDMTSTAEGGVGGCIELRIPLPTAVIVAVRHLTVGWRSRADAASPNSGERRLRSLRSISLE